MLYGHIMLSLSFRPWTLSILARFIACCRTASSGSQLQLAGWHLQQHISGVESAAVLDYISMSIRYGSRR